MKVFFLKIRINSQDNKLFFKYAFERKSRESKVQKAMVSFKKGFSYVLANKH